MKLPLFNKCLGWTGLLLWALFTLSLSALGANVQLLDKPSAASASALEEEPLKPIVSPTYVGLDLQYSPMSYSRYQFTPNRRQEKTGQGFRLGMEWLPIQNAGKLGVGGSAGFFVASDNPIEGDTVSTLYVVPIESFVSYHFDYVPDQVLVPYGRLGANLSMSGQGSRTGGVTIPGMQPFWGWNFAAGLQLNLSVFDKRSAKKLDASVGINQTYLIAEFTKTSYLGEVKAPDLSFQAFRVGLRFEM